MTAQPCGFGCMVSCRENGCTWLIFARSDVEGLTKWQQHYAAEHAPVGSPS